MATVIKLKNDIEIKGCDTCPFLNVYDIDNCVCSLSGDVSVYVYKHPDNPFYNICGGELNKNKAYGCPIIEIKEVYG